VNPRTVQACCGTSHAHTHTHLKAVRACCRDVHARARRIARAKWRHTTLARARVRASSQPRHVAGAALRGSLSRPQRAPACPADHLWVWPLEPLVRTRCSQHACHSGGRSEEALPARPCFCTCTSTSAAARGVCFSGRAHIQHLRSTD